MSAIYTMLFQAVTWNIIPVISLQSFSWFPKFCYIIETVCFYNYCILKDIYCSFIIYINIFFFYFRVIIVLKVASDTCYTLSGLRSDIGTKHNLLIILKITLVLNLDYTLPGWAFIHICLYLHLLLVFSASCMVVLLYTPIDTGVSDIYYGLSF